MKFFASAFILAIIPVSLSVFHPTSGDKVEEFTYEPIPGHFIITLKDDVISTSNHHNWLKSEIVSAHPRSKVMGEFNIGSGATGYYGKFDKELLEKLSAKEEVAFIEQDQKITLNYAVHVDIEVPDTEKEVDIKLRFTPKEENGSEEKIPKGTVEQKDAPWGLSRISSRAIPTDYGLYQYPAQAGTGVDVYVVDTGIMISHSEFQGRAVWGANFVDKKDVDGHGHGTHCAGTVGGKTYGVAKNARLIAVKVLDSNGSGSTSGVIGGINYVATQHKAKVQKNPNTKSVGSMSLGGGRSRALDASVNAAISAGVHFSVAAGNENSDACNTSPAAAALAITVGASDNRDNRAYFSNWGKCVHIHAPGVRVLSCGIKSNTDTAVMSGTSMATPHVAGALALFLSVQNRNTTDMKAYIAQVSTKDALKGIFSDTANRLLNTNSLWETTSDEINQFFF